MGKNQIMANQCPHFEEKLKRRGRNADEWASAGGAGGGGWGAGGGMRGAVFGPCWESRQKSEIAARFVAAGERVDGATTEAAEGG